MANADQALAAVEGRALLGNLTPFTVPLFDQETGDLGSGTVIRVGPHILVATAGHCVPVSPSGRVRVLGKTARALQGEMLGFPKFARAPRDRVDVAFLEVDRASAEAFLAKEALPLDRVADIGNGDPSQAAIVMGGPASLVPPTRATGGVVVPICAVRTEIIPEDEWAELLPFGERIPKPDSAIDVFLDFPVDGWWQIKANKRDGVVDPKGTSGGGIWSFQESQIPWSPDVARLFAIQSRWDPRRSENRYLRGTQIIHWLRLVASHYPGLAPDLERRFPRLRSAGLPS